MSCTPITATPWCWKKATACMPRAPRARSIWTSPAASASTAWATVTWPGPRPCPTRPTSCSTPPTCTILPPAASWPKSCASAPDRAECSLATPVPRPTRVPSRPPASTVWTTTARTAPRSSRWSTASMAAPSPP